MALADYLQPHERVAAESGHVAATNLRLIHYVARSGAPLFRDIPYSDVQGLRLAQRPRLTTVVLGALIAALSLLAGPGTPLQLGAAGLGVIAVLMGVVFGDLSLVVATGSHGGKPQRLPLRETGRRESQQLVAVALAAMNGEYDFTPPPTPAPLAPVAVARSVLLLPGDDAAGAVAALNSDADALCFDLTTLVHPSRRDAARELVQSAVGAAARGRQRVWVRVSLDEAEADLAACVWPGLTAVVASMESPEAALRLDTMLTTLEDEREPPERVRLVVNIETAAAAWNLRETLSATTRVSAALAATHDALDLLGRPDARATWTMLRAPVLPEAGHLRGRIAAAAAETGVPVYACLATGVARGGLTEALGHDAAQRLTDAATAARAHGYRGAVTLHPAAIAACNAAFPGSPPPSAPTPAAPAPSRWQPVVPAHFGIGVTPPPAVPATAAPVAEADDAAEAVDTAPSMPPAPARAPTAPAWQPVVPSHFGIRVPPRQSSAPESVDGARVETPEPAKAQTTEES